MSQTRICPYCGNRYMLSHRCSKSAEEMAEMDRNVVQKKAEEVKPSTSDNSAKM